jgi:hypothetical protein
MQDEYDKTDFATLYFDPREKLCLLVAEARRGRAIGEVGEPVALTDAEFDIRIGGLLLQFLDSYRSRSWSQETARRSGTTQEERAFTKKHLSVGVARPPSGDLVITPLHHEKGGYIGKESDRIVVPSKDVPDKIAPALRKAFSRAT